MTDQTFKARLEVKLSDGEILYGLVNEATEEQIQENVDTIAQSLPSLTHFSFKTAENSTTVIRGEHIVYVRVTKVETIH